MNTRIKCISFKNRIDYTISQYDLSNPDIFKDKFPDISLEKIREIESKSGSIDLAYHCSTLSTHEDYVSVVKIDLDNESIYLVKNSIPNNN